MKLKGLAVFAVLLCAAPWALAQPTIQAAVNAASYGNTLAPGTLASIFGTQLAASAAGASAVPLPLQLNGVSVTVGGIACPLTYVSPGQINAVIPFEAATLNPGQTMNSPIVVTTSAGASAAFSVVLSRNAPGIFTQNGAGTGGALVFDANLAPATSIGTDPIILYATGLGPTNPPGSSASGGAAAEPLNRLIDSVTVVVGEYPAQVLFAGLAPGLPGVYQLNVVPNGPISNRVWIVLNQQQSNIATLPIPLGTNVTNVSASIVTEGQPLIYPAPGREVTFSEVLFGAVYSLKFDFVPGAKPFQVVARYSGIYEVINIDPVSGAYSAMAPSPSAADRAYNFQALGHTVINFATGQPFPGNVVPASLLDPVALDVAQYIPQPSSTTAIGDNFSWEASGKLPSLTHFDINDILYASGFGGFASITDQHGGSLTATFEIFVDGLLALSQNVTFPVQ